MIIIKTKEQIKIMREGGKILAGILKKLVKEVRPGATTGRLEEMACFLIREDGGRPSFKGYKTKHDCKPFPTALCVSVNNEVVHTPALPSRKLNDSDIIGIDIGMEYKKYFTDMAVTAAVGKISKEVKRLIKVTEKSLALAIKKVKPGATLNDIAAAIQNYAESNGFSVVRDLVGHGVGVEVHEDPQIPNFVVTKEGYENVVLKPGMVLAIEPMVNMGSFDVESGSDGFSILTKDGSLSAHFEHTITVTEEGCEVLTKL
jgi:methionyl aminopeptidase